MQPEIDEFFDLLLEVHLDIREICGYEFSNGMRVCILRGNTSEVFFKIKLIIFWILWSGKYIFW